MVLNQTQICENATRDVTRFMALIKYYNWKKTVDPLFLRNPKRELPIWSLLLSKKAVKLYLMEGTWLYQIIPTAILWVPRSLRAELS